ncbi:MAG: hypothetical protein WBF01_00005, partial [Candidatus Acidiferrum sp.]
MTSFLSRLALAAASLVILCAPLRISAQATAGTKQSAETRLAAAANPRPSGPAQDVVNLLSATHRFEQAAISPDGKKVAWVEDVITKRGISTGETAIFVEDLATKNPPKRISASPNDALHAEGSVAWSPDS